MISLLELSRKVDIDPLGVRKVWKESVLAYIMLNFFSCLLKLSTLLLIFH